MEKYDRSGAFQAGDASAAAFFDTMEARGWIDSRGFPIANWRAAYRRFATGWREQEQSKALKRNGSFTAKDLPNDNLRFKDLPPL